MAKGNKRSRIEMDAAASLELADTTAKRARGAQRQAAPVAQQDVAVVDVPVRDRREVMADVARR